MPQRAQGNLPTRTTHPYKYTAAGGECMSGPCSPSHEGDHLPIIPVFYSQQRHCLAQLSPQSCPTVKLNFSENYFDNCLSLFRIP